MEVRKTLSEIDRIRLKRFTGALMLQKEQQELTNCNTNIAANVFRFDGISN
jgi:hypothetical protein